AALGAVRPTQSGTTTVARYRPMIQPTGITTTGSMIPGSFPQRGGS
nr:hypothetical protein [Tanacetum cinerariifolium]